MFRWILIVALAIWIINPVLSDPRYDLEIVGPLKSFPQAEGSNNRGDIAFNDWKDGSYHGFVVSGKGDIRDLGPHTWVYGINDAGAVSGQMNWQACLWRGKRSVTIAPLESLANDANNAGQVVGGAMIPFWWGSIVFPFIFDGKSAKLLSDTPGSALAISDQGLTGGFTMPFGLESQPCLWTYDEWQKRYAQINLPLPSGGLEGCVYDIDPKNSAVGYTYLGNGFSRATIWVQNRRKTGYMAKYLTEFEGSSWARAINSAGQIVGSGDQSACLWQNDEVFNLNDCVRDSKDCQLFAAVAINDRGQITCRAQYVPTGYNVVVRLVPLEE